LGMGREISSPLRVRSAGRLRRGLALFGLVPRRILESSVGLRLAETDRITSMPVIIFGKRCKQCSTFADPREMIGDDRSGRVCWKCYENHCDALKTLGGEAPRGCHECGATFTSIAETSLDPEKVRMFLHWRDGCYQILCPPCSDKYVVKRKDLYKETEFGALNRL